MPRMPTFMCANKSMTKHFPISCEWQKHTKGSQAKARIHFLLGQIYNLKGDKKQAYKSLSKVASLSPPYEVQLNARVLQAEVVSKGKSKAMLSRLNRMAKKAKNIKYSDQIYHAIGNIHLAANDTDKAVAAYEQGVSKSTRSGVEKGALLLKLAGIYYSRNEFTACRRCLSKGAGMISKERKDYDSIQALNKVITKLEPHTAAVFVQDSMQALAKMPTDKQNAVFDKAIELEKKRIREERRKAILSGNKGNTGTKNAAGNANKNNNQASAASTNTGDDKKPGISTIPRRLKTVNRHLPVNGANVNLPTTGEGRTKSFPRKTTTEKPPARRATKAHNPKIPQRKRPKPLPTPLLQKKTTRKKRLRTKIRTTKSLRGSTISNNFPKPKKTLRRATRKLWKISMLPA